jgi:nitrous oxidase accessory protein
MKKSASALIFFLFLSIFMISLPQIGIVKSEAKMIVVPEDYTSIQEAIDSADAGDTVFVKSGLYYQTAIINKSLSLVGENEETTIIDANGITTVIYIETDHVNITGFTIRNAHEHQEGILLLYADYCNISGNKFVNNPYGIDSFSSSYNIVARNVMRDNGAGISISGFNNSVYGNEILNCNTGIQISHGANNTVSENNLVNNSANGFNFYDTKNNYIIGNNVTNSGEYGILFTASNDNRFSRNNFSNDNQTFDSHYILDWTDLSVNIWDNGFEGNYWSNYNGTDSDGDGIGDTPHVINENNQDNYPLIERYIIPEFPSWVILPLFLMTVLFAVALKKRIRYLSAT